MYIIILIFGLPALAGMVNNPGLPGLFFISFSAYQHSLGRSTVLGCPVHLFDAFFNIPRGFSDFFTHIIGLVSIESNFNTVCGSTVPMYLTTLLVDWWESAPLVWSSTKRQWPPPSCPAVEVCIWLPCTSDTQACDCDPICSPGTGGRKHVRTLWS